MNERTPDDNRGDTAPSPEAATVLNTAAAAPQIPGFRVTRILGEGGMARVFLAEDLSLKRPVALKVMSAALNEDDQFRQRFDEEGQIVAKLRHPNLVMVFASGEVDGQRYIVMEYVAGGTLSDRIANGAIDAAEAVAILRPVADALRYSHEHGIVHRDVKPGNILFTANHEPVLSDFGIAKSTDLGSVQTATGGVIGSPQYMAPEQLLGKAASDRTDVYSLGLVLFEMLTGAVPPRQMSIVRSAGDVKALEDALPGDAKFCAEFVGRCLRLEPAERPSAQQCVATLTDLVSNRTIRKKPASRTALYAAVAVLIVGGAYVVTRFGFPDSSDHSGATMVTQSTQNDRQYLVSFDVQPSTAAVFIDGERVANTELRLTPGAHQAVVVSKDSYGQLLAVDASVASRYAVALTPIDLPTEAEFAEFNTRFDQNPSAGAIATGNVVYEPYVALLKLQANHLQGMQTAVAEQLQSLRALAKYGDPASRLVLFIAATDHLADDPTATALEWVKQASDDGYALATFYYALHYRWSHEVDGALDATALHKFRDLMALAERQGLGFARNAVRDADTLLRNT